MTKRYPKSRNAKSALLALHGEFGSWRKVANHLSNGHLISDALICRVATGKQKAPNSVLAALGLPLNSVPITPCKKCGEGHSTKRCTHKKTLEENTADYEAWKKKNFQKLASIVAWAESRTE